MTILKLSHGEVSSYNFHMAGSGTAVDPFIPIQQANGYVWDTVSLAWVPMQQPILNAGSVTIPGTITIAAQDFPFTDIIDADTGLPGTLDEIDYNINSGKTFYLFGNVTIPGNSSTYVQFKTDGKALHLKRSLNNVSTNNILYTTFEAPTITDGTIVIPSFNAKRSSSSTSVTTWYSNPTGVSGGTQLHTIYLPGTSGIRTTEQSIFKIVYKPNTTYVVKIDNLNSGSALFYYSYYWTEL